jgi:serine/threonine protein kinase
MNKGDIWGKWIIRQYLGGGGMGDVFLAMNLETSLEVALKRVRRNPGPEGEEKIAAERMGAELEQRLSSIDQRVTKVFWFGEIEGDLAIEMELIDGRDLASILASGPLEPGRAAVIAAEICEMLKNLRGLGVIHGDLKPKNVRIDSHDRIKVMDFGVAKALSQTRDYTASLFGSIAYCSPERLDTGSMDAHSDLWSVGVMLYQMLAGRLPFAGATAEVLERRIRYGEPPSPLDDNVPEGLRRIAAKMLSRDIRNRYANETQAREDLERFLRGEQVTAELPAPRFGSDTTIRTDSDATIRTDPDATIRTVRPIPDHVNTVHHSYDVPWKLIGGAAAVLVFFIIWLVRPTYLAWADSRELKVQIESEQLDAEQAWTKYQQIVSRNPSSIAAWSVGGPLKAHLISAGDRPILDFRNNEFPTAREAQWRNAEAFFTHALAVDPGDKVVKAKLRLCEGHLERITASGSTRQQMLNEAALKFQEAAELWKSSPDPYLGLERLFAYSDPDRAQSAAEEARKLGHTENRRELSQLADGYFRRATLTASDAKKFRGITLTERDYLFRARQDFERAKDLYSRVGSYGNAADNLVVADRDLGLVQQRLEEMDRQN